MAKRKGRGASLFGLRTDEYDYIRAVARGVRGPVRPAAYVVADTARSVADLLFEAEAEGVQIAKHAVAALTVYGLKSVLKDLQEDFSVFVVDESGRVCTTPTYRGIRRKHGDGTTERLFSQTLWYEMSWEEFGRYIANLIAQRGSLDAVIAALSRVLPLRERFPGTLTPGEACEQAGIDPRQFELSA